MGGNVFARAVTKSYIPPLTQQSRTKLRIFSVVRCHAGGGFLHAYLINDANHLSRQKPGKPLKFNHFVVGSPLSLGRVDSKDIMVLGSFDG